MSCTARRGVGVARNVRGWFRYKSGLQKKHLILMVFTDLFTALFTSVSWQFLLVAMIVHSLTEKALAIHGIHRLVYGIAYICIVAVAPSSYDRAFIDSHE